MTDDNIEVSLARVLVRLDRQDEHLVAIRTQVELTNGRVTTLELGNAVREGARIERGRILEEQRKRRALILAARGWVSPTIVAAICGFAGALAVKFI